jgi:molybdopterin converting factor subunit 1
MSGEQTEVVATIGVTAKLFAGVAEAAGRRELAIDLAPGATVESAFAAIAAAHPALTAMRDTLRFAVNREFTEPDQPLADGDELALIPPVSGG